MSEIDKHKWFFRVTTHTGAGGFTHTSICVQRGAYDTVSSMAEECEGNKVGYGTAATAETMQGSYRELAAVGYSHAIKYFDDIGLILEFQHYDIEDGVQRYCELVLEPGRHYKEIKKNMKLFERIAKKYLRTQDKELKDFGYYTFQRPEDIISTLLAMGFQEYMSEYGDPNHINAFCIGTAPIRKKAA